MSLPKRLARVLNTLQICADYSEPPLGLRWRSNTFFIVATVGIGLFTDLFLYGLVVPILPFMLQDRIGLPYNQIQSHVDGLLAAYAGASVVSAPIAGFLADRMSTRQSPFLLGLTALLGATIMLFLGRSIEVLVFARVLQGTSGAFVWTIGLALCLETVGPENLGKTIGSIFSFISVGTLLAPPLGGILYKKTGYTGIFGVGLGIIAIDFLMRLLLIEKKVAHRYGMKDPSSIGGPSTNSAPKPDDNQGANEEDSECQPLLGNTEQDEMSFKLSERQLKFARLFPILPCLANLRLLTALLIAFIQALLFGNFDATIPTVAQEYYKFDSLKAGLLFLPQCVFDLILGPVFGWCVDRFGTKPVAVFSYVYLIPVLILLRLPRPGGNDQMYLYAGLIGLSGIGLAGIGAPSLVEAGIVVQKYHETNPGIFGDDGPYAQLYGLNCMMFSAGLTIGPLLAGELKQTMGYGDMNIVLAAICAGTALLSFFYIGEKPKSIRSKILAL
ncbi:hypothetical protein M433DRAFT_138986 [Acidomyces richmondensis BFW]|nr:MAG: hypothetical protein FE78DRAFT_71164 [Acidomyces sp. 'richmondensis']KYG50593.1 hypothetical protein M433DRAFT_138986 [Acidomyces richmondensis BFW]